MRRIYTKASTVLAWTGVASETSDQALQIIENLGNWLLVNEDVFDGLEDQAPTASIHGHIESLGFPLRSQNWEIVWQFLERPYWTRIWIIQELAVRGKGPSSQPCLIICGQRHIPKSIFEAACAGLLMLVMPQRTNQLTSRYGDMLEPLKSLMLRARGHSPGLAMCQVTWAANPPGRKPVLTWLQSVTWRFEATDERDKLYALLGLAGDDDQAVEPEYSKPTAEVLMDYVQFYVNRDKSLECIDSNRTHRCTTGPTWAPELHREHYAHELILRGEHNIAKYNAAASRKAEVQFNRAKSTMQIGGVLVGTLDLVIGPWLEGNEMDKAVTHPLELAKRNGHQLFLSKLQKFLLTISDDPEVYEACWRTLVADRQLGMAPGDEVEPAPPEMRSQSRMFFGLENSIDRTLPDDVKWGLFQEATKSFQGAMAKAISNRTFIKTSNGRMGLGPYQAKVGDLVAIVYGSRVPFVLRPTSTGTFEVLGSTYIHGLMHGEFFSDGLIQEHIFELS